MKSRLSRISSCSPGSLTFVVTLLPSVGSRAVHHHLVSAKQMTPKNLNYTSIIVNYVRFHILYASKISQRTSVHMCSRIVKTQNCWKPSQWGMGSGQEGQGGVRMFKETRGSCGAGAMRQMWRDVWAGVRRQTILKAMEKCRRTRVPKNSSYFCLKDYANAIWRLAFWG